MKVPQVACLNSTTSPWILYFTRLTNSPWYGNKFVMSEVYGSSMFADRIDRHYHSFHTGIIKGTFVLTKKTFEVVKRRIAYVLWNTVSIHLVHFVAILCLKCFGSQLWPFKVTLGRRSHDHSTRTMRFSIHILFSPTHYVVLFCRP